MKKVFIWLAFAIAIGSTTSVTAQTVKKKVSTKNYKTKVKPTTTTGEKVHNAFSKNNKSSGIKMKSKNKHTNAKIKTEVRTKRS